MPGAGDHYVGKGQGSPAKYGQKNRDNTENQEHTRRLAVLRIGLMAIDQEQDDPNQRDYESQKIKNGLLYAPQLRQRAKVADGTRDCWLGLHRSSLGASHTRYRWLRQRTGWLGLDRGGTRRDDGRPSGLC